MKFAILSHTCIVTDYISGSSCSLYKYPQPFQSVYAWKGGTLYLEAGLCIAEHGLADVCWDAMTTGVGRDGFQQSFTAV